MSNQALNAHILFGEPCGPGAGLDEIADWAGEQLISGAAEKALGSIACLVTEGPDVLLSNEILRRIRATLDDHYRKNKPNPETPK